MKTTWKDLIAWLTVRWSKTRADVMKALRL